MCALISDYQIKNNSKYMPKFIDADSSINEMLELLKNYRTETKSRECSQLHFDSKFNSMQVDDFSSTLQFTSRNDDKLIGSYKLSASLEKTMQGKEQLSTIRQREDKPEVSPNRNIFNRLYDENRTLRQRRERLLLEGRKSIEEKERKQCTFSPQTRLGRMKTEKPYDEGSSERFYQKNMDWQERKDREIKKKQCEMNSESLSNLTFTPKINSFRRKNIHNKENSLLDKKGVEEFLHRQSKAKIANGLLQTRKKPYTSHWTAKKGYFSQAN